MTNPKINTNIGIMIPRLLEKPIKKSLLKHKKVILLMGARQVGKTTLTKSIQSYMEARKKRVLYLNCDLDEDRNLINTTSITLLEELIKNIDFLFIDEVQQLDNPGLTLKILHDNFRQVKILATGSSSFDLKNKMSDPLTGRYLDFTLYPFSFSEIAASYRNKSRLIVKQYADQIIPSLLLYGYYPDVYNSRMLQEKQLFLAKIVESYLYRDILSFQKVRHSQVIKDLTVALAYQIGSEVNENELSNRLKVDRKTIVSYLDILEKSYVIVRLHTFSKNPRREIGKNYKAYFTDVGIRNALIKDFNPIDLRQDRGALWENFLIMERFKLYSSINIPFSCYFWRSYGGAEVDFIEKITQSNYKAFEFKYGLAKLSRGAFSFTKKYGIGVELIDRQNYLDFFNLTEV